MGFRSGREGEIVSYLHVVHRDNVVLSKVLDLKMHKIPECDIPEHLFTISVLLLWSWHWARVMSDILDALDSLSAPNFQENLMVGEYFNLITVNFYRFLISRDKQPNISGRQLNFDTH
jgi:hypothetical protein